MVQLTIKHKYIYTAIVLYLLSSYLHVGYVHADEYYQIFQFAATKIGLHVLRTPWEYTDAMRSALLPSVIVLIYRFYALFTVPDPFVMGFIMRLVASIISLTSIILMLQVFLPTIRSDIGKKYLSLLGLFTLAGIYFNIHYCSENISGSLFLIAFSLTMRMLFRFGSQPSNPTSFLDKTSFPHSVPLLCRVSFLRRQESIQCILIGLFLALAFTVRFQVGFLIIGLLAWLIFIQRINFKLLIILLVSLVIGVLIFNVVIDYWYYNHWTITAWNYFRQNIVLDKVNGYGTDPWYYYIYMGASIIPFGPLYVVGCIVLFVYKPKHPLTWTLIPFILIHSLIGHKEIRFMAPITNIMPLCLIYAVEILEDKFGINFLSWKKTIKILWWINCLSLIVMAIPPTTELPVFRYIYKNYPQPTDYYFLTYGGSDVDFYKRQNLISHKIDKLEDVKCDISRPCLLALTCGQAKHLNFPLKEKEVYTQCPSFIFKLNVGDWINRTAIYKVYRLN